MRVVIDTNVVVSAALKDRIPEEVILFIVGNPEFEWMASAEIVSEYISVLGRKKFGLPGRTLQKWQKIFERQLVIVEVTERVDFPRDQGDAKFFECALTARAVYLISGDKDIAGAYKMGATTVIAVSAFKRLIADTW